MLPVSVVIEGPSDEGIVRALLRDSDLELGQVHGRHGKDYIRKKIPNFNQAARHLPWFVLADLDDVRKCPGHLVNEWVPQREELLIFRFAVAEIESWILADRDGVADFLGVSVAKIPTKPDELENPKEKLLNLAKASKNRVIREGLVPRPGSGASVGPTYVSEINDFGVTKWRPRTAAGNSPSLQRCLDRLRDLSQKQLP